LYIYAEAIGYPIV
jgi:hypothetical protein